MCICPQQVCAAGKATSCPSRSSTDTVACPAAGTSPSTKHVTNSPMRTPSSEHAGRTAQ